MRSTLIILFGLTFIAPAVAAVYMQKNPDGSVEYTDTPASKDAKQVELKPVTTYKPAPAPPPQTRPPPPATTTYRAIAITSPGDDEAVRDNTGNLHVSIEIDPPLKPKHRLVLRMDDNPVAEGRDSHFQLSNVERGTHRLAVDVVDEKGGILSSSSPITFHMLRITVRHSPPPAR